LKLYFETGQIAKAEKLYEVLKDKLPDNPELAEIKNKLKK
jgi:hypothetical protein